MHYKNKYLAFIFALLGPWLFSNLAMAGDSASDDDTKSVEYKKPSKNDRKRNKKDANADFEDEENTDKRYNKKPRKSLVIESESDDEQILKKRKSTGSLKKESKRNRRKSFSSEDDADYEQILKKRKSTGSLKKESKRSRRKSFSSEDDSDYDSTLEKSSRSLKEPNHSRRKSTSDVKKEKPEVLKKSNSRKNPSSKFKNLGSKDKDNKPKNKLPKKIYDIAQDEKPENPDSFTFDLQQILALTSEKKAEKEKIISWIKAYISIHPYAKSFAEKSAFLPTIYISYLGTVDFRFKEKDTRNHRKSHQRLFKTYALFPYLGNKSAKTAKKKILKSMKFLVGTGRGKNLHDKKAITKALLDETEKQIPTTYDGILFPEDIIFGNTTYADLKNMTDKEWNTSLAEMVKTIGIHIKFIRIKKKGQQTANSLEIAKIPATNLAPATNQTQSTTVVVMPGITTHTQSNLGQLQSHYPQSQNQFNIPQGSTILHQPPSHPTQPESSQNLFGIPKGLSQPDSSQLQIPAHQPQLPQNQGDITQMVSKTNPSQQQIPVDRPQAPQNQGSITQGGSKTNPIQQQIPVNQQQSPQNQGGITQGGSKTIPIQQKIPGRQHQAQAPFNSIQGHQPLPQAPQQGLSNQEITNALNMMNQTLLNVQDLLKTMAKQNATNNADPSAKTSNL